MVQIKSKKKKKKALRLVSRSEVARQAGVSQPAVTQACDSVLRRAVHGKQIDIDHPDTIKYIKTARARKTESAKKEKARKIIAGLDEKEDKAKADEPEKSHYTRDEDVRGVMDLTIRELLRKHGTDDKFVKWVTAAKALTDIEEKTLKMEKFKGSLISKDMVRKHIFGAIDAVFKRLLSDSPRTISRRVFSLAKSKGKIREAEKIVTEILSGQLKSVKTTAKKILKEDNDA